EDADKLVADDLPLLFRIGDTRQFLEEAGAGIHRHQVQAQFFQQVLLDFLKLVLAQHAVVDEHADQAPADRAMYQNSGDRGIDPAGKRANHSSLFADRLLDLADALLHKVLRSPFPARAAYLVNKVAQQIDAVPGVMNFGVELHGPDAPLLVLDPGQRVAAARNHVESAGEFQGFIAMRHPDVHRLRQRIEDA